MLVDKDSASIQCRCSLNVIIQSQLEEREKRLTSGHVFASIKDYVEAVQARLYVHCTSWSPSRYYT